MLKPTPKFDASLININVILLGVKKDYEDSVFLPKEITPPLVPLRRFPPWKGKYTGVSFA